MRVVRLFFYLYYSDKYKQYQHKQSITKDIFVAMMVANKDILWISKY